MSDIAEKLIDQVKQAAENATPLKIVGGGSKTGLLSRDFEGQEICVAGHSGIVDYQPSELVMTVRAGTPLQDMEEALAEQGQMLSFEPPYLGDGATIGGTLACNLSGPARPWGGSVRDHALGVRLINGKGEHLRFGGQVMKNVAGYDGSRLQAGALGTLGVMSEVSLKVLPRPEKTLTLVQEMNGPEAITKMNALSGQPKPLTGACWQAGKLYLRLSGAERAVEGTRQQWGGELLADDAAFWQGMRELSFASEAPLWRFSIKSTAPMLDVAGEQVIDWAGAQRWISGAFDFSEMEKIAAGAQGHVTLFKGGDRSGEVRQGLDPLQQKLQKRLKEAFDPKGIFNPGALYSWM